MGPCIISKSKQDPLPIQMNESQQTFISNKQSMQAGTSITNPQNNVGKPVSKSITAVTGSEIVDQNSNKQLGKCSNIEVNVQDIKVSQQSQEQQQQIEWHRRATPSIIIKTVKKNDSKCSKQKQIDSMLSDNDNWNAEITQEKQYSKICVTNNNLDNIQFILPKAKAGPLIVPFINYQQYCLH